MVCQVERTGFLLREYTARENLQKTVSVSLSRIYASTDHILFEYLLYSEEKRIFIFKAMELPKIPAFHGSTKRTLNKKSNCTSIVNFAIIFPQKTYCHH